MQFVEVTFLGFCLKFQLPCMPAWGITQSEGTFRDLPFAYLFAKFPLVYTYDDAIPGKLSQGQYTTLFPTYMS